MAEQKTKPTEISVGDFLESIPDEGVRNDCRAIARIMQQVTGEKPIMWGSGIVGFGRYHYKYESGHEGYACLTGFAPRKGKISLYVMPGVDENKELLASLGKHKAATGCIYINKLADVDVNVLNMLIEKSVDSLQKKYPA